MGGAVDDRGVDGLGRRQVGRPGRVEGVVGGAGAGGVDGRDDPAVRVADGEQDVDVGDVGRSADLEGGRAGGEEGERVGVRARGDQAVQGRARREQRRRARVVVGEQGRDAREDGQVVLGVVRVGVLAARPLRGAAAVGGAHDRTPSARPLVVALARRAVVREAEGVPCLVAHDLPDVVAAGAGPVGEDPRGLVALGVDAGEHPDVRLAAAPAARADRVGRGDHDRRAVGRVARACAGQGLGRGRTRRDVDVERREVLGDAAPRQEHLGALEGGEGRGVGVDGVRRRLDGRAAVPGGPGPGRAVEVEVERAGRRRPRRQGEDVGRDGHRGRVGQRAVGGRGGVVDHEHPAAAVEACGAVAGEATQGRAVETAGAADRGQARSLRHGPVERDRAPRRVARRRGVRGGRRCACQRTEREGGTQHRGPQGAGRQGRQGCGQRGSLRRGRARVGQASSYRPAIHVLSTRREREVLRRRGCS
ncbi:hypothetical protein NOZE110980_17820 [Nocardioides zeicaulis]